MGRGILTAAIALSLGLGAGCGRDGDPDLLNFASSRDGPEEFEVLPTKPLQMPENLAALPAPTPGGTNRTDPTPKADAILALGGNPGAQNRPSADGALVAHARRFGSDPAIRSQLAAADLEFRRENDGRLLERWFDVNVYFDSYQVYALNKYRELERFRAAGVPTPAAPPPELPE